MVETAGNKLRRARLKRQLSIEDAARGTKIRPRQIADLERDEYSNFANLAYARGFLVGYAKYLHVDVRSYLEAFEDASTFGMDDYQYLSEVPMGNYRAPVRRIRRRKRRGRLLAAGVTLCVLAVAAASWFLVMSYHRLGNLGDLDARLEAARERATHPSGNVAPPQGQAIPVSVPVSQPPALSSPAPLPVNDKTVTTSAALAAVENTTAVPVGPLAAPAENRSPAVPLPGDGTITRALTQGADLRATLAGVPAGLLGSPDPSAAEVEAKIRAAKPALDPAKRPDDPYQGGGPQPVSNNTVR